MIIIEAIMLTCMMIFGGYCTYTDLKTGIVLNKLILMGLLIGLVLNITYLFFVAAPYYP